MTVGQMIKALSKYPKDTLVVQQMYSNLDDFTGDWRLIDVFSRGVYGYEQFYPKQWRKGRDGKRPPLLKVLKISGN